MHVTKKTMLYCSGLIWLAVGIGLFTLGFKFLSSGITAFNDGTELSYPLIKRFSPYLGGEEFTVILLMIISAIIGYLKATFVLTKTVNKSYLYILSLKEPAPITKMYPMKYFVLLALMGCLGFLAKYLPLDARGMVDIAVGFALITGAIQYFYKGFFFQNLVSTAS